MSRFLQVYGETGIEKTPIKYIKTGCALYAPEICVELNGLSDAREKLKVINSELVSALERVEAWAELSIKERCDIGSQGQQDYYRDIARQALAKARSKS